MDHMMLAITAALVVPIGQFLGMMGTAALALLANGEDPRAALAMPRTIFRHAPPCVTRAPHRPGPGAAPRRRLPD
jgi:hypothetical protein